MSFMTTPNIKRSPILAKKEFIILKNFLNKTFSISGLDFRE